MLTRPPGATLPRATVETIEVTTELERRGMALAVGFAARIGNAAPIRAHFVLPDLTEPSDLAVNEAMLLSTIALAMQRRAVLRLPGPVSRSLRHGIDLYQRACMHWWPQRYCAVPIEVDVVADRLPVNADGMVGFSGGLDSTWSARTLADAGQVKAGVLIEGYDIDVGAPGQQQQRRRVRRMLDHIGIDMISISTEVRAVLGQDVIEGTQASYLAAALTLLSDRFGRAFVASSFVDIDSGGAPDPVHEATVPLLGSSRFPLLVHGGPVPRIEKLARLATEPELFGQIRVCYGRAEDGHCGHCAKCLINALACVAVTGAWPDWCPRNGLDLQRIAAMPLTERRWRYGRQILRQAALNDRRGDWQRALERRLDACTDMTLRHARPCGATTPRWRRGLRRAMRIVHKALPRSG